MKLKSKNYQYKIVEVAFDQSKLNNFSEENKKLVHDAEATMNAKDEESYYSPSSPNNPSNQGGSNFSLEHWKDGKLTFKLISSSANFKSETQSWSITNAQVRIFKDSTEQVYFKQKLDTVLEVRPEDFGLRSEIVATMNWSELNAFIEDQKLSGSGNVAQFELEKENRTATPFSILVLTVIGVSIASRKSRGGIGFHLALAIIIGFIFIFISISYYFIYIIININYF
jgi:lipopolysaccharide export system permease protein